MAGLLDFLSSNGLLGQDHYNPASYAPNRPMPWANIPDSPGFGTIDMSARQQPMPQAPQVAPQTPQASPGFLGGIGNALADNSNMLMAMGAGLMSGEGFGGGLKNAMVGAKLDRDNRSTNQTAQALVARGLTPDMARIVASNPRLLAGVMKDSMGLGGEYSLTPVYGKDAQGNTVLIQPGKSGTAIQTKVPEGVTISSGVDKIDLGTQWGIIDKRTGNIVGYQPKDITGKEAAEERGKIQGQAQGELPAVEMTAKRTIQQIDDFIKSEGFNEVFGPLDQYRPNITMSSKGRESLARFKQLSGRAFLEGRAMLKGGGAITDFESGKAESAIARLERSLNEEDAKAALEDFKDAVSDGAAKLRARAGQQAPAATTQQAAPKADPLGIR